MSKKIIITGASGFIGTALIPKLLERGLSLHLVGRSPEKFATLMDDGVTAGSYETLSADAKGADAILHLAVRNNDQGGDLREFQEANVELPKKLAEIATTNGIRQIINMTTLHALASPAVNDEYYAATKAEGESCLNKAATPDLRINHLRLPAVYNERFKGNLSVLNRLPGLFQAIGLKCLQCIKPTVHTDRVADAVLGALESTDEGPQTVRIISDSQEGNWVYAWLKSLIDLGFALIIFLFLGWLLIIVWFAVKLTSTGPGLFTQTRVGQYRKPFTLYKFRTMSQGVPDVGTHEMSETSITKVGSYLRKTKIDELPQIANIFLGQMSLVGPRPCLPVQEKLVEEREKRGVSKLKGGITGLAQINNIDMSTPVALAEKDAEYMALRTTLLDLKIVLATATGGGQGDKIKSKKTN